MKKRILLDCVVLVTAVTLCACGSKMEPQQSNQETSAGTVQTDAENHNEKASHTDQYGAEPSLGGAPITLNQALEHTDTTKMVKVSGVVEDVCQKKGCWMILKEGEQQVRVTFKDYGFFVPTDIAGKEVTVEGIISETTLTEADARHYAEDAGASPEDIEKIVGDQKEYSIVAESVLIPHSSGE